MYDPVASKIQIIREGIDAIDKQVLELISHRLGLALQLRDLKGASTPIWAPDREHFLLQRLLADKPDNLHDDLVVRVWSTLISASLQAQGDLQVFYQQPEHALLAEMAFPGAPARTLDGDWVADLVAHPQAVGLLPPPDADHTWWLELVRADAGVFVQTALPKLTSGAPQVYCLAHQPAPKLPEQLCLFVGKSIPDYAQEVTRAEDLVLWQVVGDQIPAMDADESLRDGGEMPTHVGSFFPPLA